MQDLVNTAIDNHQEEQEFRDGDTNSDEFDEFGDPNILVVGCGGAGNNTVNRLYNMGVGGGETIALNTDKQHLKMIEADTKILVGKSLTEGLGAGGDPSMGARATEMAQGTIKEALGDPDLVFVTAGMGGGTGTGVLAAALARAGATVVTYERDPEFAAVARDNFELAGVADAVEVRVGDVTDELDTLAARESGFDLVTLDTADAPAVVERVPELAVFGGFCAVYSPFVGDARDVARTAREVGLSVETTETIRRELDVDDRGTRPSTAGVGHTGYLTFARMQ